jgi:hypothetical protein
VSRISEKRLAEDLAAVVERDNPARRRRDVVTMLITFAVGASCNFVLGKIEIAIFFWSVSLMAIADLALSFVRLIRVREIRRLIVDLVFAAVVLAVIWPSLLYPVYASQHAALLSGVLRTPQDGKDRSHQEPELQLSESGPTLNGNNPLTIPHNSWKMHRENNQILFSTTVRDKNGLLIVDIKDNHWTVASSTAQCWDKNYTDDRLEVLDGQGRVVLQLMLKPDKVIFQAEYADLGWAFIDGRLYNKDNGIPPWFKYPSREHWGELNRPSNAAIGSLHDAESLFEFHLFT